MASIIGDKYRNAVDTSNIDASIASVTASLNEATSLYNQAMTAIATCDNSSVGCLSKTGRHISTWRDQRDRYSPLITQYKNELTELLKLKSQIAGSQSETAQSAVVTASAQQALANADATQTKSAFYKYALIFGGIALFIVIGIFAWKKLKKK